MLRKHRYIIGIDEVGRGPIAGPVAVGSCVFLKPAAQKLFRGVRESKQLTEEKREEWYAKILKEKNSGNLDFCVTFQSHRIIDDRGLSYAIRTALRRSLCALELDPEDSLVLLDGGLKAPPDFINQKTIIKGDEKEMIIALASICAKVERDRVMRNAAKKYPAYSFDRHKGYGTRAHYRVLSIHGITPLHHKSFLKRIVVSGDNG